MREVPIGLLHERLSYNKEIGDLFWKHTTRWTKSGQKAGTICNGYIKISIDRTIIPAHRIVWAMHYGRWPFGEIDHINGQRSDNRLENLREVTHQQNCLNRSKAANNRSGYKGVSWHEGAKKWQAHVSVGGKSLYLGLFDCAESAAKAYSDATSKIYGEFAKH